MQIICLANSWRPGGHCIAGIDRETGNWIRPVPPDADAIPCERCVVGGAPIALLDVLDLEVAEPREAHKYQRENRILKSWAWAVRERVKRTSIEPFVDDMAPLFHTTNDRVVTAVLEKLAPSAWKSLQLVRPRNLRFERDGYNQQRWRARFRDKGGTEYQLKVTDPNATRRLEAGERIHPGSLLTVSLTRPWTPTDRSQLVVCYKIVAAVIEP